MAKTDLSLLLLIGSLMCIAIPCDVAAQPSQTFPEDTAASILQAVLGLVTVLLIFGGFAYILKRFTVLRQPGTGRMHIVSALSVNTRDRVLLLQVGEKQILISASPGNIRALHVFDEQAIDPEEDPSTNLGGSFKDHLVDSIRKVSSKAEGGKSE